MKKISIPFSMSVLCGLLAACGGGSNTIHEDPIKKPDETTAVGCTVSQENDNCFEFVMEYPVAGLQYTCTSDKVNTFITQQQSNTVTGGCNKNDTATFFLNVNDSTRIEFGQVKLSELSVVSARVAPVHLTVLDMARGLTGKAAQSLTVNDETTDVALQLIKILQAVGVQKAKSHVQGDVQLFSLRSGGLVDLEKVTAKVDLQAIKDGSYVEKLKPWVDVSQISDVQALSVLKQISHVSLGAIYQADPPVLLAAMEGLIGYTGQGTSRKTLLGNFLVMTDRQGYAHGYGVQWRGVPERSGQTIGVALDLMLQTNPMMMSAKTQSNWIDILTHRLNSNEKFTFEMPNNEIFQINQGRLLGDYGVAGSDVFYKFLTKQNEVISSDLATWTQTAGNEKFEGKVDFLKAYPIAYLDQKVFKSERTVASKEKYYFPLYATLTFRQDDKDLKDLQLGIVIDEFGDIRTDIKVNATEHDMSGQCGVVSDPTAASFKDNFGVQQYRIGTVGGVNYQPNQRDLAITPRIILSGSQFGLMNGALVGINSAYLGDGSSIPANRNGVKINLYNLITGVEAGAGGLGSINITKYDNSAAEWVNIYHIQKSIFIDSQKDKYKPTDLETKQKKSLTGGLAIQLAPCYTVKTKA